MDQQLVGEKIGAGILPEEQNKYTVQIELGGETQTNQHIVHKKHSRDHMEHNTNISEEDSDPGVSSPKKIRLRAEQLFHE
eukprot:1049126-Heterocapsa_arctica.AAC.1